LTLYGFARPFLFSLDEENAHQLALRGAGLAAIFSPPVPRSPVRAMGLEFPNPIGLAAGLDKNADTPPERAVDDYAIALEKVYPHAAYITINISSPNTKGLRTLQEAHQLDALLGRLAGDRTKLAQRHGRSVPLVVKVAPDLSGDEIQAIADAVRRHRIDGLIATNTTVSRAGVEGLRHANEAGGLSGAPVREMATRVLAAFGAALKGEVALIGAGGIMSGAHAAEKFRAGASLVQLYTGLIYRGPDLVCECASAFRAK